MTHKIQINSLGRNKPIFYIKRFYSNSFSVTFVPDCFQMCLLHSSSQFHARKATQCVAVFLTFVLTALLPKAQNFGKIISSSLSGKVEESLSSRLHSDTQLL